MNIQEEFDMISPEDFESIMISISETVSSSSDKEIAHKIADGIMMTILTDLGYGKGVDVFNDMPKWYA